MLGLRRNGPVQGKQLVLGIEFLNECKKAQIRTRRRVLLKKHADGNAVHQAIHQLLVSVHIGRTAGIVLMGGVIQDPRSIA